jgi:hypothetical protein
MYYNLLFDNNLTYYGILIGCGLILSCSLFYLIRSNNTAINENRVPISNANIEDVLTDNDSDTESDYISSYDTESTLDVDINELDLIFHAKCRFYICSIQELKNFEISSIYYR